jgi:hypothetical protein
MLKLTIDHDEVELWGGETTLKAMPDSTEGPVAKATRCREGYHAKAQSRKGANVTELKRD